MSFTEREGPAVRETPAVAMVPLAEVERRVGMACINLLAAGVVAPGHSAVAMRQITDAFADLIPGLTD